jgi:hypothetical protein
MLWNEKSGLALDPASTTFVNDTRTRHRVRVDQARVLINRGGQDGQPPCGRVRPAPRYAGTPLTNPDQAIPGT